MIKIEATITWLSDEPMLEIECAIICNLVARGRLPLDSELDRAQLIRLLINETEERAVLDLGVNEPNQDKRTEIVLGGPQRRPKSEVHDTDAPRLTLGSGWEEEDEDDESGEGLRIEIVKPEKPVTELELAAVVSLAARGRLPCLRVNRAMIVALLIGDDPKHADKAAKDYSTAKRELLTAETKTQLRDQHEHLQELLSYQLISFTQKPSEN